METQVNLKDLRAFVAVVDHGSITAAAAVLGETKGTISRRISRLEENLSIALVQRVGGRAQATSEGLSYRKRAQEALDILDNAKAEMIDQEHNPHGHLRITALQGLAKDVKLGKILGEFIEAYPEITVETLMTEKILSFREDQIDFAFRLSIGDLPDSGHKAMFLTEVELGFVASPAYLAKYGTPQHPDDLQHHRLLIPRLFGDGMAVTIQPRGEPDKAQEFDLRGHLLCQDIAFLEEAALAGGGLFLLFPQMQKQLLESGEFIRVLADWEPTHTGKFYLMYPSRPLSSKARVFKDFIQQAFGHCDDDVRKEL
ncbi:MAG: LysR family transcriptional regulator [Pseudomonadales bacterium]|nr:LysR family transcriptional regulator [Pseudomonadales bacterium]